MKEEFESLKAEHEVLKKEREELLSALERVSNFNDMTRPLGVERARVEQAAIEVIEKIKGLTC